MSFIGNEVHVNCNEINLSLQEFSVLNLLSNVILMINSTQDLS